MKVRCGFVANSSSSSFVLIFENNEQVNKFEKLKLKRYYDCDQIKSFNDFIENLQNHIKKQMDDYINDNEKYLNDIILDDIRLLKELTLYKKDHNIENLKLYEQELGYEDDELYNFLEKFNITMIQHYDN